MLCTLSARLQQCSPQRDVCRHCSKHGFRLAADLQPVRILIALLVHNLGRQLRQADAHIPQQKCSIAVEAGICPATRRDL